ncbi:DNA repair protein RecN [Ectothiorhodospiraceae bacterium 2226]|nr:DNA repair protein RecN [Ectothiorhodospiraceae bacterium 2226]
MLTHIHIRNIAIVDALELEFHPGMTVLTGETGAGKSILLDALGLALGDRADAGLVRHGAERAEVSVGFRVDALTAVQNWLAEHELDADAECLLRRTVSRDGRSRGYINGQPVTVQLLREVGEMLVDLHGQHEHQSLLRAEVQRELLDDYAEHGGLVAAVAQAAEAVRAADSALQEARAARASRDDRLDLLRFQVAELEALQMEASELDSLEEEHARLAHANRLLEAAEGALARLEDSEEASAAALLGQARRALEGVLEFDARLRPCLELLDGALIQAQEAAAELRHYATGVEFDPARLAQVEQRLGAIHDLARKHRAEPAALPALLVSLRTGLDAIENAEAHEEVLAQRLGEAQTHYREAAKRLSASRARAAKRMGAAVSEHMQGLGMAGGVFAVRLDAREDGDYAPHGAERVVFDVSANAGQPPRPLAKVASGGELSRISLAIQVVAAHSARIPTLVFDEVDVGIGGGVAEIVGRQLRGLGSGRQVLCVTHLPQVAALAHHHLQVRKQTAEGLTLTAIEALDEDARVEEIARMLGGVAITAQTRAHAREMIERAGEPLPA